LVHYAPPLLENESPQDGAELVIVPATQSQASQAFVELNDHCSDALFLMFTSNWRGQQGATTDKRPSA